MEVSLAAYESSTLVELQKRAASKVQEQYSVLVSADNVRICER